VNIIQQNESVTRIVEELKRDAALRRRRFDALSLEPRSDGASSDSNSETSHFPQLTLGSTLQDKDKSQYSLQELLAYEDLDFVHNAYQAVLKRPPEPTAVANALDGLGSSRVNKLDLLTWLVSSEEAREKRVHIQGLRLAAFFLNLSRLPLLRYVTGPVYELFHWRSNARDQRRNLRLIMARQDMIASYINENLTGQFTSLVPELDKAIRLYKEQKETYDVILERISDLSRYSEERHNETAMQRQQDLKDRTAELEQLRKVYNQYRTQVELTEKDLKREMEHLFRKYQEVKTELVYQNQRLSAVSTGHVTATRAPLAAQNKICGPATNAHDLDAFFASFDEHFRGDRQEVKRRLRAYLPTILDHKAGSSDAPILDVACGRGEWLEVLQGENLVASGVDTNSVLVAQCLELGLEVKQADLGEYLIGIPDGSLGAVSAFHIVEHLPIERLVEFLNQALRVLRSGGLLLIETPNPQNVLVGSCNFYLDPTHRKPLPSPVLKYLVESRGFLILDTLALNPSDEQPVSDDSELAQRFNEYFYGPMDYAIVARKV
jgi:SAM-dependent methyltransferase